MECDVQLLEIEEETIAGRRPPVPRSDEERFMLRALLLAERGRGRTSPNPMVGALIVKDGKTIGEGWHARAGGPHAEVSALRDAGEAARGATLFVTLEPCNHEGRTPPCAKAVKSAGIARVVMAMGDPNPDVRGGGFEELASSGIVVEQGPYEELAGKQNEAFLKLVTTGLPFVTVKMAMSLDGRVATNTGSSKWISGDGSREQVHVMRGLSDAVMVGIGTVLKDDPMLTARTPPPPGKQPLRVIVDWEARTPVVSNVADVTKAPTLLAVSDRAPQRSVSALEETGVEVVRAGEGGRVDLSALMGTLAENGVMTVLCEGGPGLAAMLFNAGLVDKLVLFVAPLVISGRDAPGPIGGEGIDEMMQARQMRIDTILPVGEDIRVVAYPRREREIKCSPE